MFRNIDIPYGDQPNPLLFTDETLIGYRMEKALIPARLKQVGARVIGFLEKNSNAMAAAGVISLQGFIMPSESAAPKEDL